MPDSGREPTQFEVELARTVKRLSGSLAVAPAVAVDHPSNEEIPPTLTIGLATYDDFDGAYFTVTSLLTHHREAMQRCEIVVLDNHPEGLESEPLQDLAREYSAPPVRYLPYTDVRSTAVRDVIFSHARTPWVMVVDSHVLLESGAVDALLAYIDANPDSPNLIQGPLVRANGTIAATQMDPGFGGAMYGIWGTDDRIKDPDCEPFEIPSHGLALFAMNTDHWPGLNQRFTGFGGEEGYVHEKVRQAGGVTLCLPKLRWHHRFARPKGIPYPMNFTDRVNNYIAGWTEIGWDVSEVHRAFSELLGDTAYAGIRAEVERRQHHPADATIVCIASDDDRVGPWRKVRAEADEQGLQVVRISASVDEFGDGWWNEILAQVATTAARRRWTSVTVIDERLGLPTALFYRIAELTRESPGEVIRGTLEGETVIEVIPESVAGSPAKLARTLEERSGARDIELDEYLLRKYVTPDLIAASWTINTVDEESDWIAVYGRWARAGMATTMHRLAALVDVVPELQHAFGWAVALKRAADVETPVIIARSDIYLSEDVGPVVVETLHELSESPWDLVSLSTPVASGASVNDPTRFTQREAQPDCSVVIVSQAGAEKLAAMLPDPTLEQFAEWQEWLGTWGDLTTWLAAQIAEGGLIALATRPAMAVTHESWKRELPARAGRMRR